MEAQQRPQEGLAKLADVGANSQPVLSRRVKDFLRGLGTKGPLIAEDIHKGREMRRAARGIICWQTSSQYFSWPPGNTLGHNMRPQQGCNHSARPTHRRIRIASSDLSSASRVSPYPDLASTVVVPCEAISWRAPRTFSTRSFLSALRTASTLERMPPPAAAISS